MELLILLAILQVADAVTTVRFLRAGAKELNPILQFLIEEVGVFFALLLTKSAVIVFGVYIYNHGDIATPILACLDLFYAFVVVNNYRIVK